MARLASVGATMINGPGTPASHLHDEEIISYQIQSELKSQSGNQQSNSARKKRKHRSRDDADVDKDRGGEDGSPKKKRKRKSKHRHDALDEVPDSDIRSSNTQLSPAKPTAIQSETPIPIPSSFTAVNHAQSSPANAKSERRRSKEDKLSIGFKEHLVANKESVHRSSLGSNHKALIESILKSCSPDKAQEINITSPEMEKSASEVCKSTVKDEKKKRKPRMSHGVKMPENYKPIIEGYEKRYPCPVETCVKEYSRHDTLKHHLNATHSGEILQDNKNGTMSVVGTISRTNEAEHMESSTKPSSLILPAPKLTAPVLAPTVKQREANIEQPKKNVGRPKGSKTVNKTKAVKDSDIRNPVAEDASSEDRLETNFVSPHSHLPNKRRRPNSAATAHMAIRCSTSELEDWELGVGRVINIVASNANSDISDEEEDDIAFSASYLDKHDSGITFGSVNFTIMRLRGGASQNWESANSILYICSVASGKVNVKIDGKDFTIGANGIWRVRQGEQCTVTNRFYGEAVIHVCTTRQ